MIGETPIGRQGQAIVKHQRRENCVFRDKILDTHWKAEFKIEILEFHGYFMRNHRQHGYFMRNRRRKITFHRDGSRDIDVFTNKL